MTNTKQHLRELKKKAETAVAVARRQERGLYSDTREPVALYPYERHKQMLASIRSERNATLREIEREAQQISTEGRRQVELAREFPRDAILSSSARTDVRARSEYLRGEFASLSPTEIARKLEWALANGTQAEKFAAWQVAGERARKLEEQGVEHPKMGFYKEFAALDEHLFAEEFKKRAASHVEIVNEAENLVEFAHTRSRDAKNIVDAYGREAYRHVTGAIERQRYNAGGEIKIDPVPNEERTPVGRGEVARG